MQNIDQTFEIMLDWDLSDDRMDLASSIASQCVYHASRLRCKPAEILAIIKMDVEQILDDEEFLEEFVAEAEKRELAENLAVQIARDEAYVSCLEYAFGINRN